MYISHIICLFKLYLSKVKSVLFIKFYQCALQRPENYRILNWFSGSLNYRDTKGHIINNLASTLTWCYTLIQADLKLTAIFPPQIPNYQEYSQVQRIIWYSLLNKCIIISKLLPTPIFNKLRTYFNFNLELGQATSRDLFWSRVIQDKTIPPGSC